MTDAPTIHERCPQQTVIRCASCRASETQEARIGLVRDGSEWRCARCLKGQRDRLRRELKEASRVIARSHRAGCACAYCEAAAAPPDAEVDR